MGRGGGAGGTGIAAKKGRNRTITQRQFGRDSLYSSAAQQCTRWTSPDSISCRGRLQSAHFSQRMNQNACSETFFFFSPKSFSQGCGVKGQHYTQEQESKPQRKGTAPDPLLLGKTDAERGNSTADCRTKAEECVTLSRRNTARQTPLGPFLPQF